MNNINCRVDFMKKQIVITKRFYRESQVFGTEAFEMMLMLQAKLPNFKIMIRKTVKCVNTPYMPSYSLMEDIIMRSSIEYPIVEEGLKEFGEIRDLARLTGKGYRMVRKWFLEKYSPIYSEKEYRVA